MMELMLGLIDTAATLHAKISPYQIKTLVAVSMETKQCTFEEKMEAKLPARNLLHEVTSSVALYPVPSSTA